MQIKERPILFSGEMVRAILDGRKTQTRRVVKWPSWVFDQAWAGETLAAARAIGVGGADSVLHKRIKTMSINTCPYGQPGDRLVVAMKIDGFGDNYCAGSNGVIYSKARGERRPLKAHLNGNGYRHVTVMDNTRKTTRAVHTLVCCAFYGQSPFPGAQVRHLDGNAQNNDPSNLAWGTQADNWTDRRAQRNGVEGEKHYAAKLNDEERAQVRWAIERGLCSQRHAARTLGMSQGSISELLSACELRENVVADPGPRLPRITLEVTGVRVERLQDTSEADAQAEGVTYCDVKGHDDCFYRARGYRCSYAVCWDSINAKRAPWSTNPWVWVVEFKKL